MEIEELRLGKYKYNGCKESAIADPYSVSKTYSKGDLVMNNGYLYSALSDMEAGDWDATKWLKTNLGANIPITTADLVNESSKGGAGFLTSAIGTWDSVKEYFIPDSRVVVDHMSFKVNKTIGLPLVQGNTCFSTKLTDTYTVFYTFNYADAGSKIASSIQCTALSCTGTVSPNSGFCPVTVSANQNVGVWAVSALHETYGANGITAMVPIIML